MYNFNFSNLNSFVEQPNLLKPENFYAQGIIAKNGRMTWSVQCTHHPKWIPFFILISYIYSPSLIVQGKDFLHLAQAAANEEKDDAHVELVHDEQFARFCRKLTGVETAAHKQQRQMQLKEKFARAVAKAKIIGKGLVKNPHSKILEDFAWLEALSPDHRYGFELQKEWKSWQQANTKLPFNEWREQKGLIGAHENQVKYLNEEERKQYEVTIDQGKLIRNDMPLDTSKEKTIFSGKGIGIFVVSPEDILYIGSHNKGKFHHSSFLSGAPIKGGGEIQTDSEGYIKFISSKSGHYNPGKKELLAVIKMLQDKGIHLETIKLCIPHENGDLFFNSAARFLLTEGNLPPDGIEQADIERNEKGKILAIYQQGLHESASNNRELLQYFKEQGEDLSQLLFKENTLWGDVFSYNAEHYLMQRNILPKQWEGGEYLLNENNEVNEIRINTQRPLSEDKALEKDILVLNAFAIMGVDLSSVTYVSGPLEKPVNAQKYLEKHYLEYMNGINDSLELVQNV